jgi:transcriptional regulator with XRE-family HTH domain
MARRSKPESQHTGLFHAREAVGMSRSELVRRSGISKQQLSRLENGVIRLRLDHLKPFAPVLGFTPEQILLWGKLPGTEGYESPQKPSPARTQQGIPELDNRGSTTSAGKRSARKDAPVKTERWGFPESFVREQLHTLPEQLVVIETEGDSMAPTIASGERVIVDTEHKTPSPDGLYALRDPFGSIIIRRLQLLRSSKPTRIKVVSDNPKSLSEEASVDEIEIFGKVLSCLKLF